MRTPLRAEQPLALYMEGWLGQPPGKMGHGVLRYSPNPVACVIDSGHAGADAGKVAGVPRRCPVVADVAAARALGAEVLVLGIAPAGGLLPPEWFPAIDAAVALGMSVVNSGLHDPLAPRYAELREGQWVWDVRVEPPGIGVGTGAAREMAARRVLMVGTDMAVGKMTAGLEIWKTARERGVAAGFVATGQIGIVVSGGGVPLDAVRLDFATGAIESEVVRRTEELIIVEGQGSILHPGSSATLPLIRGTCPTHLVLCARAGQETLLRVPWVRIPPLARLIALYEDLACALGAYARPQTAGVALNTAHLDEATARSACAAVAADTGLPCTDPVRFGAGPLVDALTAG